MSNTSFTIARGFKTLLLAGGASAIALSAPAYAQDNNEGLNEGGNTPITVTGSRIQRRDFESNSPIVTVDESLFENTGTAALESNLNKLPQFTPDKTATLGGDIQPTATNTPGSATISLRGIGANRNLVLLDGRRTTPANALGVVDINSIPSAAIERVEIITGGASSTYGADAVGGVVNFILKKDFEGLEIDGQLGTSGRGDSFEYSVSGIMGANFDDGRGNVSLSFSTNQRNGSYQIDRPWYTDQWRDSSVAGNEFFPDFPAYQPIAGNNPDQGTVDGIFGGSGIAAGSRIYFNPDGTAFTGFFQSPAVEIGTSRFNGDLTGGKWKLLDSGALGQTFQDNFLILPLTRYNFSGRANYEINDWIGVFAQGIFSKVKTQTVQQPSPAVNGWSAQIPNDGREVPDELQEILDNRTDPTGNWQLTQYLNWANRASTTEVYTYNIMVGLEGHIPSTDWTYEIYGSQGESNTSVNQTGFASLSRYREIVTAPNWGEGFSATGNAEQFGFGASSATCTSGLNPFMPVSQISADCIEAVSANIKAQSILQQTVWEANLQGGLFDLPAGQVRAAIGASYRKHDYRFENDTLTTQGRSFNDQAIGLYPSGNSSGEVVAKEVYGELLIPLLSGVTGIQELNLEIGGRISDYNTTGTSYTYKVLGDWMVTDWLRFRGGYNRAERAPNIGELFLAPQQTFAFAPGGDVCSLNNGQAWSAGTGNTTNRQDVENLCRALMNRTGDTNTADNFYNDPTLQIAGGGFVFPTLTGNPNLTPEVADTWTAGFVINSPFDAGVFSSLRVAVDYYNIKVSNAIGPQSFDLAQRQCTDTTFNPTLDVNNQFCDGIARNITVGTLGNVSGTYVNNGRFQTSGIDVQLDWATDVGAGRLSINSILNYLIEMKSATLAVLPLIDYAGTLGMEENGLNDGHYRWKLFSTVAYSIGKANVAVQWQHLPSINDVSYATNPDTTIGGAPAYNLFNLSGGYAVTDNASIRVGIDNLFDKAPPRANVNSAPPAGTIADGAIDESYYDVLGRRFYIGASLKF